MKPKYSLPESHPLNSMVMMRWCGRRKDFFWPSSLLFAVLFQGQCWNLSLFENLLINVYLMCIWSGFCQQLHASVRTANLETSLRLLASGADPNYVHPVSCQLCFPFTARYDNIHCMKNRSFLILCECFNETDFFLRNLQEKSNTALHVAALSNQPNQVELLLVYGADPGTFDIHGKTPSDVARQAHAFLCCSFKFKMFIISFPEKKSQFYQNTFVPFKAQLIQNCVSSQKTGVMN